MIQLESLQLIFKKSNLFTITDDKVVIDEPSVNSKVKKLSILNQSKFLKIDTKLIKDFSTFFTDESLTKDCDGVVVFETPDTKYIFIVELKSGYNSQEIFKAKDQIISTYIKLNILLNIIHPFNKENYVFKGFIIALTPGSEKITGMSKLTQREDIKFAYDLSVNRSVNVRFSTQKASQLPLNTNCCFDSLDINFIGADSAEAELDTSSYL